MLWKHSDSKGLNYRAKEKENVTVSFCLNKLFLMGLLDIYFYSFMSWTLYFTEIALVKNMVLIIRWPLLIVPYSHQGVAKKISYSFQISYVELSPYMCLWNNMNAVFLPIINWGKSSNFTHWWKNNWKHKSFYI